jgi:hypothetical protein
MIKLVEVEPGRWRVARETLPPARSDLPLPYVISDTMDPVEQVDGKFYESKALFRAVGRANGLTEVGNERFKPKTRSTDDQQVKRKRRETIQKVTAEYRSGRRARVHENPEGHR